MAIFRQNFYGSRARFSLRAAWFFALVFVLAACNQAAPPAPARDYTVVNTYPHDPAAFTQGLLFLDGVLYESTGLNGRSSLRKVELKTGKVLQQINVPTEFFAEGLALLNGKLYQLTWQNKTGFIYDLKTFDQLGQFFYPCEGWGLATDGKSLILSDGSDQIRFLEPLTFSVQRTISVHRDNGQPVANLNELEYIKGEIYANIWQTDDIVRIDPATGKVLEEYDLSGLLSPQERADSDVLNGIAYDPAGDHLYVTGKLWPKLFEIKLKP